MVTQEDRINGQGEIVEPSLLSIYAEIWQRSIMAKDAEGMKGYRTRNKDGELRDKRNDTLMGTIEKQYGRDFHVRKDMLLGNYLKKHKIKSLNDLITGK